MSGLQTPVLTTQIARPTPSVLQSPHQTPESHLQCQSCPQSHLIDAESELSTAKTKESVNLLLAQGRPRTDPYYLVRLFSSKSTIVSSHLPSHRRSRRLPVWSASVPLARTKCSCFQARTVGIGFSRHKGCQKRLCASHRP